MRKTLLLFTTMALALVRVAGMAGAALPAPTLVSTVPISGATKVDPTANIKAKFSEAMKERSIFYFTTGSGGGSGGNVPRP